ncbi:MAG: DUF72 domain-containing protein [Acidobacteria bacterium]|nr:DUF72 domain-containing protein [Acidobacteriota bacterium]
MKFGKVENPEEIDFAIPADHPATKGVFASEKAKEMEVWVGCAKWNSKDLKGFYPKGVKAKDELRYYSTQFNCIELNATFYKRYWENTYTGWHDGVEDNFKFFPKFNQGVTHYSRLKEVEQRCEEFAENIVFLKGKLGVPLLQMHDNFGAKDYERVENFAENVWTCGIPIAMEFRRSEWHTDPDISERLYALMEKHAITNVLVDTAGRRDLMHMRLTTPTPFIRWVGANHASDYTRLDDWVERLAKWKKQGMRKLYFFVHQNVEQESPLLASYFIRKLNEKLGVNLHVPKTLNDPH